MQGRAHGQPDGSEDVDEAVVHSSTSRPNTSSSRREAEGGHDQPDERRRSRTGKTSQEQEVLDVAEQRLRAAQRMEPCTAAASRRPRLGLDRAASAGSGSGEQFLAGAPWIALKDA